MEYEANIFASQIALDDDEFLELCEQGFDTQQIASALESDINLVALKADTLISQGYRLRPQEHTNNFLRYCEHTAPQLLNNMNRSAEIKNMNDVKKHWYDSYVDPSEKVSGHYHDSRYHALNLHSMWQGKGIEFRMFNSTTHEGKVKAYIQFCLALNNYAIQRERRSVRMASFHEHPHQNEAQYFEYWLKKIGLVGDEYKTARLHLLKIFKEKEKTNNSVRRLSA